MRKVLLGGCFALAAAITPIASGALLSFNTSTVVAGSSSQQIDLLISGSDPMHATNVYIQVGDGGVDNDGVNIGDDSNIAKNVPNIVNIDCAGAGTILGQNVGSAETFFETPDDLNAGCSANAPGMLNYTDSGTLAVITLDTTGLQAGDTFTLDEGNVLAVDAVNSDVYGGPYITNVVKSDASLVSLTGAGFSSSATFTVVAAPEPGTLSIAAPVLLGLLARRRRGARA